ncbi:VOC family protein [Desertibaculum subflavum]|uniref:VOC family protein n=1 Tax=Desertibaculum subflavum TaxID=2268458 RepID=UPI000E672CCB
MRILSLDHVQLAMPAGGEAAARAFYTGLLGIPEQTKPPHLAARGGCWFERGPLKVHLGVDKDFKPARKAHPAFIVDDLPALAAALAAAGFRTVSDEPLEGYDRLFVDDPFGNRIEIMQPKNG